jgi:DNA-binding transcriptional regulator GbsR (MarR family)
MQALISLGLTRTDAEVYVYLAKKESQTLGDLCKALNYSKRQLSSSLNGLKNKGLVTEADNRFFALPFDEALDFLIESHRAGSHLKKNV